LNPLQVLGRLSEKVAPGQTPDFTKTHILLAILIIGEEKIGRKLLSKKLKLGEGTVRNLINRLQDEKLISTTRHGTSLTEEGEKFLEMITSSISGMSINETELTVSEYNYAVIIREKAQKVRLGIEQRDQALISGAKGATTIKFKEGEFILPGVDTELEESIKEKLRNLKPENNDVIIIGTGETQFSAKMGAYSAGLDLLS
jgi:predicted transcriptional regulator